MGIYIYTNIWGRGLRVPAPSPMAGPGHFDDRTGTFWWQDGSMAGFLDLLLSKLSELVKFGSFLDNIQ